MDPMGLCPMRHRYTPPLCLYRDAMKLPGSAHSRPDQSSKEASLLVGKPPAHLEHTQLLARECAGCFPSVRECGGQLQLPRLRPVADAEQVTEVCKPLIQRTRDSRDFRGRYGVLTADKRRGPPALPLAAVS